MVLCLLSGFLMTCTINSSSWLVGAVEVDTNNGPAQPKSRGSLGLWAGLWHANLTYHSANFSLNEQVTWTKRQDMATAHRMALEKGWLWPLVSLLAELSGEGRAWRGELGDGLRYAGTFSSYAIIASMYMWAVCMVLFSIAPELTARSLMLMGVLLALASFAYVFIMWIHVPNSITVSGSTMQLHLGWAWWCVCVLGVLLTTVGAALIIYDFKYPKQLSTIFELYADTPYHRLFQENIKCDTELGPRDEEFRKVYPPCYWEIRNYNSKQSLIPGNENDTNNNLEEMIENGEQCTRTEVERIITNTDTGKLIFRTKKERSRFVKTLDIVSTPRKEDHTPLRRVLPSSLRRRVTPEPDRLKAGNKIQTSFGPFFDCRSPRSGDSAENKDHFLKIPRKIDYIGFHEDLESPASPPLCRTFSSVQANDLICNAPSLRAKELEESSTSF